MKTLRDRIALIFACGIVLLFIGNRCPVEHFIGIPCPGCNMFSALYWLFIKADLHYALYLHPMVLPLIAYIIFSFFYFLNKRNEMFQQNLFKIITGLFITLLIAVYVYRMLTIFPEAPMQWNEHALLNRFFHL